MTINNSENLRPRYAPEYHFPSYSYTPGKGPHPTRDEEGHSFGEEEEPVTAPDPERWQESRLYLHGIDLFNHGFYWEAHEAWEDLWHACGRVGAVALFLQGLIHLTAAGLKARNGKPMGTRGHAGRAFHLFDDVNEKIGKDQEIFMGISVPFLMKKTATIAKNPDKYPNEEDQLPEGIVFNFVLTLDGLSG